MVRVIRSDKRNEIFQKAVAPMAVTCSCSLAGGSRGHRRDWKCTQIQEENHPAIVRCWIPTLFPKQSRATRDPGSHTSDLFSCKWPGIFSSLTSLLPLTLHVPAKEQECAPCRAPGSSEMSSSDDKTYLKTLNLRKIKAMTTADVTYKTALDL